MLTRFQDKLHEAMFKGDLEAVKKCVAENADVEKSYITDDRFYDLPQENPSSSSPPVIEMTKSMPAIMFAAFFGKEKIVEFLADELDKKYTPGFFLSFISTKNRNPGYKKNFKATFTPEKKEITISTGRERIFSHGDDVSVYQTSIYQAENEGGFTFLHAAVYSGDLKLVQMAVEKFNCSVNDYYFLGGWTSSRSNVDLSFEMRTQYKYIYFSPYRISALALASYFGHGNIVNYLIAKGAYITPSKNFYLHLKSLEGNLLFTSPAYQAVRFKRPLMVEVLLKNGALVDDDLFCLAVEQKDYETVKVFMKNGCKAGEKSLCKAINNHDSEMIKIILEQTVDKNLIFNIKIQGDFLIFVAFNNQAFAIVEIFIEYGFSLNLKDKNDKYLLALVIEKEDLVLVEIILNYGYRSKVFDKNGNSPLCVIAEKRFKLKEVVEKMVDLVVGKGGDVNQVQIYNNFHGQPDYRRVDYGYYDYYSNITPLFVAIRNTNVFLVEILLRKGASAIITQPKNSCLEVASKNVDILRLLFTLTSNKEFTELVTTYEPDIGNKSGLEIFKIVLFRLARLGDVEGLAHLLNQVQIDISSCFDEEQNTALHHACANGQIAAAKFLLTKGIGIANCRNCNNETPLILAIRHNNNPIGIVRLLISETSLDIRDGQGRTALIWAMYKVQSSVFTPNYQSQLSVFKMLLSKVFNVEERDENGFTLFLWAVQSGSSEVVDVLSETYEVNERVVDYARNDALMLVARDKTNLLGNKLIKKGIAVNNSNRGNQTAVAIAIESGHLSLCITLMAARLLFLIANKQIPLPSRDDLNYLFENGGSMLQRDSKQRTLLHVAVSSGNDQFYEYSIFGKTDSEKTAYMSRTDGSGKTVSEVVDEPYSDCEYTYDDIVKNKKAVLLLAINPNDLSRVTRLFDICNSIFSEEKDANSAARNNDSGQTHSEVSSSENASSHVKKRKNSSAVPDADTRANSSQNLVKVADQDIFFERHDVEGDGNCGYTAFGIIRTQAYQLLTSRINEIKDVLRPVVQEQLHDQVFVQWLIDNNRATQALLTAFQTYQNATGVNTGKVVNQLNQHANDLTLIQAYIDYDVRDKKVDTGWAHPCVLQALAHLQEIRLRLWERNAQNQLTPHPLFHDHGEEEAHCTDLMFVNKNHFERLEIISTRKKAALNQEANSPFWSRKRKDVDDDTEADATILQVTKK